MRQSIESLCGLREKDSWLASARPHCINISMDEALGRAKTARDQAAAALEAQAKETVRGMVEARARRYAASPALLDMLETNPHAQRPSRLFPQQLRLRIAELLGEETATPRRAGGEVTMLNLRAAAVYAERLCEIAGNAKTIRRMA